jgi:hypothetical protein
MAACRLAGGAPVSADDSPLSFIPEDAAIVVRLKSIKPVLKQVLPWFPEKMRDDAKDLLVRVWNALGPDVVAADEAWVAVIPLPRHEPAAAYIIRTPNSAAAKGDVPPNRHVKVPGWDILADTPEIAARFKECRAGQVKSLATTLKRPARELFESAGVASLFVDGAKYRAAFRKEIDTFKGEISAALENPKNPNASWQITDPKMIAAVRILWQAAEHVIEETDTLTIALNINEQEADLHALLAVAPNSPTAAFLARHPHSEMRPLAHLPSGPQAYFGVAGDLAELARWMAQCNLLGVSRPVAAREAIDQRLQSLPLGKVEGYYGSLEVDEALAGPAESILVLEGHSSEQAREFQNRLIELTSASDQSAKGPRAPRGSVVRLAETIAGQSVDLATWTTPDGSGPDTDDTGRALLKVIYGTNPLQETRIANLPDVVLQNNGGGRIGMLALLHNFQSSDGAAKLRGWRSTRERLGPKANLIVLLDFPRCAFAVGKFLTDRMVGGVVDRAVEQAWEQSCLKLLHAREPTFSGLGVTFEPQSVRCTLHIPREQVSGFTGIVQFMYDAMEAQAPHEKPKPAKPELAPEQ